MPKDNIHYGGWEHRDVHNVNGMLFVRLPFPIHLPLPKLQLVIGESNISRYR